MLGDLAPPRELIESRGFREVAGRSGAPEILVVVVAVADDGVALARCGGLLGEVVEVGLAEGAVVEPVVAHPAVDHRALGHGSLERRMRVDERHDHREALVRAADHADAAVGLRARSSRASRSCRTRRSSDRPCVGFSGPRSGRVMTYSPSDLYLPRTS